jgi:integrase
LTREELTCFLHAADTCASRTAALAWLLASTGLRISEACNARLEDLSGHHPGSAETWLNVTCKGQLRRSVPIHPITQTRLEPLLTSDHGPIFRTRSGRPLDRSAAARSLLKVAQRAQIHTPFSPHVLRHTFVTLARAAGCALEDVQEAAGHADPATTRAYDRTLQTHSAHPAHAILGLLHDDTSSRFQTGRQE